MSGKRFKTGREKFYENSSIYQIPEILDEEAIPKPEEYSIGKFAEKAFQLYDSEHADIELLCDNSMMSTVLDHFGEQIRVEQVDREHFRIKVEVSVSPTFFAWVFEFGGKIRILSPQNVIDSYREILQRSVNIYR